MDFFGITDYALEGVDNHECYDKPHKATSYKHSYYYMSGILSPLVEKLETSVSGKLEDGELQGEVTGITTGRLGILGRMTYKAASFGDTKWHGYQTSLTTTYADGTMAYDAYVNVPANQTVYLPDKLKTLADESLRGTSAYRFVFSKALTTIDKNAFPDSFFIIEAPEGSKALQYAKDNGIPWQVKK